MTDRWVVVLATCTALGAARPVALPLAAVGLLCLGALGLRRPALLCVAVGLLASVLAARSLAGLDGVPPGDVTATVTLLTDPAPGFSGVRADVRLGGRRLELRAEGATAEALRPRLAGELVSVRGELQAVTERAPWLVARHISGRLRVHAVEGWSPGWLPGRLANGLRRRLVAGAEPLSPLDRSLFTGLVIGDDRDQPPELADDFLGAGLTHLLAVSGQNVAFVLALAGPLLRRLRLWPRFGATVLVVALFGLTTRFEPSVLRAAAMATLAVTTSTMGVPVSRLRVLGLATTGLLLVDPLLVRSAGFQLSVAAAAAIVVASPALAAALPGPSALREPLAVTLAAQLGVAPVLVATFGPVPVASIPANLLAVPLAGLVMVWGLTAGLLAGLVGGWPAVAVHAPTRLLLAGLAEVASRASALPLGQLRAPHLLGLAGGLAMAVWAGGAAATSPARAGPRRVGLVVAATSVVLAVVAAQAPPPLRTGLLTGVVRWHAGATDVLVLGGAGGRSTVGTRAVLAALREADVGGLDLVVLADGSVDERVVLAIERRHPIGAVVVAGGVDPPATEAPVTLAPRPRAAVVLGSLEVRLTATADRLVVDARPVGRRRAPR